MAVVSLRREKCPHVFNISFQEPISNNCYFCLDYGDAGGGGGGGGINPLALLVAPLAGIALLSAAAAVALNPVLVSISVNGKKRRKRDAAGGQDEYDNELVQQYMTADMEEKIEEMKVNLTACRKYKNSAFI